MLGWLKKKLGTDRTATQAGGGDRHGRDGGGTVCSAQAQPASKAGKQAGAEQLGTGRRPEKEDQLLLPRAVVLRCCCCPLQLACWRRVRAGEAYIMWTCVARRGRACVELWRAPSCPHEVLIWSDGASVVMELQVVEVKGT